MNRLVYFSFGMSKDLVRVVTLIYENVLFGCLYICKGIMNKQIFYLNGDIYFFNINHITSLFTSPQLLSNLLPQVGQTQLIESLC